MRRTGKLPLAAQLSIGIPLVLASIACLVRVAFAQAPKSPMRWEYHVERLISVTSDALARAGKEGWELVSVSDDSVGHTLLIYKRPLAN